MTNRNTRDKRVELGASTRDLTPPSPFIMSLPVVNLGINYGNDKGRSL